MVRSQKITSNVLVEMLNANEKQIEMWLYKKQGN